MSSESALHGTPYLMDETGLRGRFERLLEISGQTRQRAIRENQRIELEARQLIGPYVAATRTDLVVESNEIEGYRWTLEEAKQVVLMNRELLEAPIRTLVRSVRDDARVYEVVGLYRAHDIADKWAASQRTPSAAEIRELHSVIVGDVWYGGRYKQFENTIGGTKLRTAQTFDVARVMLELTDWWSATTADPILVATVVHAWLAHIHPFEDGNGRLARVLANLALARHGYPPLVIRAQSDRGEYYAALATSDEGDLLPLYDLFVRLVRRQVRVMSSPNYVADLINDQLLSSDRQRYKLWGASVNMLTDALRTAFESRGCTFALAGMPTLQSFKLLSQRDADGNGWFATIGEPYAEEWLLWFGYRSQEMLDLDSETFPFPSIYISRRDRSEWAEHPFSQRFDRQDLSDELPDEISVYPARHHPVCTRRGFSDEHETYLTFADRLASVLSPSATSA